VVVVVVVMVGWMWAWVGVWTMCWLAAGGWLLVAAYGILIPFIRVQTPPPKTANTKKKTHTHTHIHLKHPHRPKVSGMIGAFKAPAEVEKMKVRERGRQMCVY
jgi:hypothetical protein